MQSRTLVAGVFAVALAALPLAAQDASQSAAPPSGAQSGPVHPRHTLPKPVNLKVLPADIKPEDLIKIMRGFSGSLGVECSFCHAENPQTHRLDFASDAKPDKGIARIMMQMTRNINETYMSQVQDPDAKPADKHVTCGTCHRGHEMPQQFVPPPESHEHHEMGGMSGAPPAEQKPQ